MITYRLKCSTMSSSRMLSGKFPTHRWRVSLTILQKSRHWELHHNFNSIGHNLKRNFHHNNTIFTCTEHTKFYTHAKLAGLFIPDEYRQKTQHYMQRIFENLEISLALFRNLYYITQYIFTVILY